MSADDGMNMQCKGFSDFVLSSFFLFYGRGSVNWRNLWLLKYDVFDEKKRGRRRIIQSMWWWYKIDSIFIKDNKRRIALS